MTSGTKERVESEPDTINLLKYLDALALRLNTLGIKDPWYVASNAIVILQEICPPKPAVGAVERERTRLSVIDVAKNALDLISAHTCVSYPPAEYPAKVKCACGVEFEMTSKDALTRTFVQHVVMEALEFNTRLPLTEDAK